MSRRFVFSRFNITKMERNRTILLLGRKGSGKTSVLMEVLNAKSDYIEQAVGMAGTRDGYLKLCQVLPENCVYSGYQKQVFEPLIEVLNRVSKKPDYNRTVAMLFDDIGSKKRIINGQSFQEVAFNSRHLKAEWVFLQQGIMGFEPTMRDAMDYIFAFAEPCKKTRQKIYDNYFSVIETFGEFEKIFQALTRDKGSAMVIDNTIGDLDPCKRIFHFRGRKTEDIPQFSVGSRAYWKLARETARKALAQQRQRERDNRYAGKGGARNNVEVALQ